MMKNLIKPERLLIFTDSVYAIAITLLVLDLKPPHDVSISNHQLFEDLIGQFSNFKAYIISFTILAKLWIKHHLIFNRIKQVDGMVVLLNFIHILFLTLVPFASSLLGHYKHDEASAAVFIGVLCVTGLSLSLLRQYAFERKNLLLEPEETMKRLEPFPVQYAYAIITLAALGISFIQEDAGLLLCFLAPFVSSHLSKKYIEAHA